MWPWSKIDDRTQRRWQPRENAFALGAGEFFKNLYTLFLERPL